MAKQKGTCGFCDADTPNIAQRLCARCKRVASRL